MESENETRLVKFALIGLFVVSVIGLLMWEIAFNPYSEAEQSTNDGIKVKSGFGVIQLYEQQTTNLLDVQSQLTYSDDSLGFQISKPNKEWEFDRNIDDVLDSQTISNKKFLGGMYVKKGEDKPFFVAVFDLAEFENFNLDTYVKSQKDAISSRFGSEITIDEFSPKGNWSIFGAEITIQNNTRVYGEQILEIHDNKLYMLQYSGIPPYLMSSQQRNDIREIIDSFKPFD